MRVPRRHAAVLLAALLLVPVALLWGQSRSAADRDELERLRVLLSIDAGSVVADVGAGDGRFAIALAEVVGPAGRVFATEISPSSLSRIRAAAARAGRANVTVVEVAEEDSRLPETCCDAIYLRNVYHHLTRPKPTVDSLFKALKPGGRLAIVDFEPRGRAVDGVPENRGGHGVRPDLVAEELTAAGFRKLQRVPRWRGNDFMILFERPAAR
jgi:ubiquinone/menaquinone biosynthesis C-methylase UbiE